VLRIRIHYIPTDPDTDPDPAFSNFFNYKAPEIILAFSVVDWESSEERNKFISEMVKLNDGYRIGD
jgi:hypothetical protein